MTLINDIYECIFVSGDVNKTIEGNFYAFVVLMMLIGIWHLGGRKKWHNITKMEQIEIFLKGIVDQVRIRSTSTYASYIYTKQYLTMMVTIKQKK